MSLTTENYQQDLLSVTVCICTYNRDHKLKRLLANILDELIIPEGVKVDFLCIDNASTDQTRAVIKDFQTRFSQKADLHSSGRLKLNYQYEEKQGLSNARNCALQESASEWLIFTDDDVILDKNWLKNYCETLSTNLAQFYGGRILLNWLSPKPEWLVDENMALISGVLVKFDCGEKVEPLHQGSLPFGASFAISRKLIDKVGLFDTNFGVNGDRPGRGEENDYFNRAIEQGFEGFYCGTAVCFHDASNERLNTQYLLSHGFEKGRAEYLFGNRISGGIVKRGLIYVRAIRQLIKGRRDLYFQGIINLGILKGFEYQQQVEADGKRNG